MNERIKQLMQKAQVEVRISIDPHTFHQYPDPNGPHTIIEFSAEKFAELIVGECANVLQKEIKTAIAHDGKETHIDLILIEHFGVEE